MARLLAICVLLATTPLVHAQASTDERVRALETENRQLRDEVQALRQKLQALEGTPAPAATQPAATSDPGANPWGNPDAIRRTLGQALRENLQTRGIAMPDAGTDPRSVTAYRSEVTRWWSECLRTRRFRQSVSWPIEVLEAAVAANAGAREYEITAYALNEAGARVGRWFVIRCPASAVPNLNLAEAAGRWTLRAEVQPELALVEDGAKPANVFRQREMIAPQVECSLRFSVAGLDPTPAPGAEPATKGRGTR